VKKNQRQGPEVYRAFLQKELGDSKQFLESKFEQAISTYVYPGGFFTPEMFPIARENGYTHMFTVLPGKVSQSTPEETLPRYIILGTHDHIFELATDFGSAPATPEAYAETEVIPTTQPVKPEPGTSITERMPVVSADLSQVVDLDPSTLVMRIAGLGEVPAVFDAQSGVFSWKVNRPLRQPICPVSVSWKNRSGKIAEPALEWWFRIDHAASYSGGF
jgi:hypothetical protein